MPLTLIRLTASALMFALWSNVATAQTVDDAQAAAKAGDFARAEQILTPMVEDKDPMALREMARLHLSGRAGASDPVKARVWLQEAAEAGLTLARVDLAYVQAEGIGGPKDEPAARDNFAVVAKADPENIEARFMWAKLTLIIGGEPAEIRNAMTEIQLAASRKFAPALAMVGDFYLSGTFVGRDPKRAMAMYQDAYANGDLASAMRVADLFAFGEMGDVDLAAARNWYARAASEGNANAAYAVASLIYMDPTSSEEDLKQAFTFATSAALAWNEDAQMLLGRMYLDGRAVAHDAYLAFKWLDLAATSAVLDAHYLRAIAARELGPEQAALARDEARTWFEANHATPHTHRLMTNANHVFK